MIFKNQRAVILMATYNGSRYLSQQICSIQAQNYDNWSLVIRDDGSTDDTINIVNDFVDRDERITFLKDSHGSAGSAVGNFSFLMQHALNEGSEYIMFSDQDDIWDSDKISVQMNYMGRLIQASPNKPFLVHTDLEVVSEDCQSINSSFMKYQGIHHEYKDALRVLIAQNFVTGCTVLINRSLLKLALPIPYHAIMHDWWLALCAASVDGLKYIDRSTLKYRQHYLNQVGAKGYWSTLNPFSVNWFKRWVNLRKELLATMRQAKSLYERIKDQEENKIIKQDDIVISRIYSSLLGYSKISRLATFNKLGIHRQGYLRQLLLKLRLFLM